MNADELGGEKYRVWQFSLFKYLHRITWVMMILMRPGWKVFKYIRPRFPYASYMEKGDHRSLVVCPCVLKTERHEFIKRHSPRGKESGLLNIFWIHLDVIITWESIHEGEDNKLNSLVYQSVDMCRGKSSFGLAFFKSL